MLHELLFALLGKPGTVFLCDAKGALSVDRSLHLFSQQQTAVLNQLAQVGTHYRTLAGFIQSQSCLIDYSISQSRRNPSVYRQALAAGLEKYLEGYTSLVQSIEAEFLNSKHFTIADIKADLGRYQLIFPDVIGLMNYLVNNNLRGGAMVEQVHKRYQTSNIWVREVLDLVLQEFYSVLMNQIIAWLLYGQIIDKNGEFFVHRVTHEPTHKFKFNNKNVRQVDITDWEMYTIEASMIPTSFLRRDTAGKILFIGKSTKILKNCEKISIVPSAESLSLARQLQSSTYSSNQLEEIIEKVRHSVAQKMVSLIMEEQNFLKELEKVNEYYLMIKGDFYQLLLQQSKDIDKIAQKEKALRKLNEQYLQNTFMRINGFDDAKKIAFELRPLGFNFQGFKTFNQLCPVGNIDLIDGKAVRFNLSDGALWHKTKQLVENDFTMSFVFRFKKYPKFFKVEPRPEHHSTNRKAVVSMVIQNSQEVIPNSHLNAYSCRGLPQFVSVDVGFVTNQKQTQFGSFINITAQNRKNGKPVLLANKKVQKINLLDENLYHLKIKYRENNKDNNLTVSLGIPNSSFPHEVNEINTDLSLPYYVNLEMGRAHVGFVSNLMESGYCAEVEQWEMICTSPNHFGDHWSDMCLTFKTSWPLDLVLTSDLLENFSRAHKFLFPIRQTQIQLEQIWKAIPRRLKQEKHNNKSEKIQLLIFERRLSALRSRICLIITQLWKYLQADVIEATWAKLKASLTNTDDFESSIRMVNKYIKSIQTMFFFNVPKVQKIINEIVKFSKGFVIFFRRIEVQNIDDKVFATLQELKDNFQDIFKLFVNVLKDLAVANSSHHLFHLSQRMVSCCYKDQDQYQYRYE